LVSVAVPAGNEPAKGATVSVQHVVLLAFPEKLGADDEAEMRRQVANWPGSIGGISALRLGSPLAADYAQGFQYLLFIELEDEAALQNYLGHQDHVTFGGWIMERSAKPLVFDYVLDESTVIR
jgi:Stress responsive A/B Barrel Domain